MRVSTSSNIYILIFQCIARSELSDWKENGNFYVYDSFFRILKRWIPPNGIELRVLNVDFLFTGAVNWSRDLSLILQACIKAEKDGSVARFRLAIFYCFKVVAVTPETCGSVVKNTSAV